MMHTYAILAAIAIHVAGCGGGIVASPDSGAGGAATIGCDTATDCGSSAPDVCIECRHHECIVYSGVCK